MEIEKELKEARSSKNGFQAVIDEIKHQQQELMKKQEELKQKEHLFKVVEIVDEIENMRQEGLLAKHGILSMEIGFGLDLNGVPNFFYRFYGKDKEKSLRKRVDEYGKYINGAYIEPVERLIPLTDKFTNPQSSYMNMSNRDYLDLDIDEKLKSNLLDGLLSKELKTILDYTELQSSMRANEVSKPKKPKI